MPGFFLIKTVSFVAGKGNNNYSLHLHHHPYDKNSTISYSRFTDF